MVTDFLKVEKGMQKAEELINPNGVFEETNPNDNDVKNKFIPIDEVPEEKFEEDENDNGENMSREEREETFAKFKKEQEIKLKNINPNMNIFDLYFKDIKTLNNLKDFLSLKSRKIFRHKMMENAPDSIRNEQKAKWLTARAKLIENQQAQGINEEIDQIEIRRPTTVAGLVTKLNLEKLSRTNRNTLSNIIIDVINMKDKIGTGVAGKFASAKKKNQFHIKIFQMLLK